MTSEGEGGYLHSTARNFQRLPAELREWPQWVLWRYERRDQSKPAKVPLSPCNGKLASVTDPSTWSTFDDAIRAAENPDFSGLGFVFTESDPYSGIDLDGPAEQSTFDRQRQIFQAFNSYSERSPSGQGLHIIVKGRVSSGRRRGSIEVYSAARFFTMTGDVYLDVPIANRQDLLDRLWDDLGPGKRSPVIGPLIDRPATLSDQVIITRASSAANGEKFNALWRGDGTVLQGGDQSGSAIDQALVDILQFYTQDIAQIERIWMNSPQGQRKKTQEREDYRRRTIARAFDREVPLVPFAPMLVAKAKPAQSGTVDAPAATEVETLMPLRRELSAPKPFPISALGNILGSAATAIVDKVQCPPAIAAVSVLGAAALAVQAHADVVIPATNHAKPTSLFLLSIAASGERKSAADHEALRAVRERERELRNSHAAELHRHRNRSDAWESERDKVRRERKLSLEAKTAALEALGPAPTPPLKPMLTCPEPTFEGLCKLYVDGMPTLGIFSDEGGQFVGGHGLSPDNRLRTVSGLCGIWDGSPIKRVRAVDGTAVLPGRRLTQHIMVQPEVASALLSDPVLKDQGYLSRILASAPASTAGTRFQRPTKQDSEAALATYSARILEILRRSPPLAPGKVNELEPRRLAFDPGAAAEWMRYADFVEGRLATGREFESIRGFANKLPEHAARLAAVLTLVDGIAAHCISIDALRRAIEIAEHFAEEALRLFDAGMVSPDIRAAESLLAWLHTKWTEPFVGLKAIYQLGPNAIREAATARKAVAILETHGWLQKAQPGTKVGGKVVKEAWRVITRPVPRTEA